MPDDSNHPLQPKLDHLAGRIETTLEEVCEEISITEAETSELIRIEEANSAPISSGRSLDVSQHVVQVADAEADVRD